MEHGAPPSLLVAEPRPLPHTPYSSCPCARQHRAASGSDGQAGAGLQGHSPHPGQSCSAPASRRHPGHRWWSTVGDRDREHC
jgi:hypothetical protein